MYSKTMMAILGILASAPVFADSLVSCKTIGKVPKPVVEYVIKSTQSLRLNSGVFYTSNDVVVPFDQLSVAQYKTSNKELYLIVDNSSENILVRLEAERNCKSGYRGNVTELNPLSGAAVRKVKVQCQVSPL